jgi:uncharacterized protein YqiB (DUF1249 family)
MLAGYVPDLADFIDECEANYRRVSRILTALTWHENQSTFPAFATGIRRINISLIDRSRYTTTLSLSQDSADSDWAGQPDVVVRLYHDARLAEVLSYARHTRVAPVYPYPNPDMYHRDEKAQLNRLLGEWLDHCLESEASA